MNISRNIVAAGLAMTMLGAIGTTYADTTAAAKDSGQPADNPAANVPQYGPGMMRGWGPGYRQGMPMMGGPGMMRGAGPGYQQGMPMMGGPGMMRGWGPGYQQGMPMWGRPGASGNTGQQ
jgi:hypothetical protein